MFTLGYSLWDSVKHPASSIAGSKTTYLKHVEYRNLDGVAIITADFNDPEIIELCEQIRDSYEEIDNMERLIEQTREEHRERAEAIGEETL